MRAIEHRYTMATRAAHFPTSEAENLMDAYEEVKENSNRSKVLQTTRVHKWCPNTHSLLH